MKTIIRNARQEDMRAVLTLIQELADFEKEPEAVDITVSVLETHGFGSHPSFQCFVAEEEEGIVGIALVYFRFSTWKGPIIHLEDLMVSEKKRGAGIGAALYRRVMEYAAEQGVKRVSWEVLDWNTPAIDFYEKSGAKILDGWHVVQMDEKGLTTFLKK